MIVDTNALSAWRDDNDEALTRLLRNAETLVIPVIVIGEYRYGIVRLKRRRDAETWLRRILQSYRIASGRPGNR